MENEQTIYEDVRKIVEKSPRDCMSIVEHMMLSVLGPMARRIVTLERTTHGLVMPSEALRLLSDEIERIRSRKSSSF